MFCFTFFFLIIWMLQINIAIYIIRMLILDCFQIFFSGNFIDFIAVFWRWTCFSFISNGLFQDLNYTGIKTRITWGVLYIRPGFFFICFCSKICVILYVVIASITVKLRYVTFVPSLTDISINISIFCRFLVYLVLFDKK